MLKGKDTKSPTSQLSRQLKVHAQMSEEQTEDIYTIRVMTLNYAVLGQVSINMSHYVKKVVLERTKDKLCSSLSSKQVANI